LAERFDNLKQESHVNIIKTSISCLKENTTRLRYKDRLVDYSENETNT